MKWRVVLAVLFVLLLFAGFADLYVSTFVRKQQHAIILFVINGMDLNTLNLARQQSGLSAVHGDPDDPTIDDARRRAAYRSERLNLESFWNVALLNLQEPGQPVPDEGANATALACGQRVANGFVAANSGNEALRSLIYAAQDAKRATGLVTTRELTAPTPKDVICDPASGPCGFLVVAGEYLRQHHPESLRDAKAKAPRTFAGRTAPQRRSGVPRCFFSERTRATG